MHVVHGPATADGLIRLLGVDDVAIPEALTPSAGEVLLQADGPVRWSAVCAAPTDWTALGAEMVRRVPAGTVAFASLPALRDLRDFVVGWRLGGYRFAGVDAGKQLLLATEVDVSEALARADATCAARDLVNTASNTKNPQWLVQRAREVARRTGATIDVLGVPQLRAGGFGGVLAVGAGSASPPRVVVLRRPGSGPKVVLVGKGITFDSGGLSLKPREAMMLMKSDMAGAAAVLSALPLAPDGLDVTVLIGLAENAIGAGSYRPGDVITHVGGLTTEVRNTDAEGRLVLADLLAFASAELDPDVIVDVATLTGAATLALSREMGAILSPRPRLLGALRTAAQHVGEPLWPLPLVESYRPALRSQIADQCHIPTVEGVGAGAITAALFLQAFVGDVPWAHLDIAGPARAVAASGVRTPGGTGFGAALLGRWMASGARF